jgi:putative addiction module killer protein
LIQFEGHFGDHKSVSKDNSVWELRWASGRRVYYSIIKETNVLLLLGGNKNGQNKDIAKAKKVLATTEES